MMADYSKELAKYDYVQFVIPDINTIPRGKVVKGKFKEKVARDGYETGNVICLCGPNSEVALTTMDVMGKNFPNEWLRPCMDTLTPWPWVRSKERRVGNVLCDLVMKDGRPDLTSPRQLLKAQLDALRDRHGLVFTSAFEYEFRVYKEGCTEFLGGNNSWIWDVRYWGQHLDLFGDLTEQLGQVGVEVSSLMPEHASGMWEITTDPEAGMSGGNVAFYVKNAVKGFFSSRGYHATFMTKPTAEQGGSSLHLNFSLWTQMGGRESSAMWDESDPDYMSSTARHFLAGILTHAPAMTALCCPTLNCYRGVGQLHIPEKIVWGVDDRNALVRVRNTQGNVFFENRLPSPACCPYLAMAATVAAGLDGLERKLACPPPMDVDQAGEVPKTLAQALDVLEKDEQMCSLLGDRFISCYTKAKREYEVQPFEKAGLLTEQEQIEFERNMYLKNL